MHGLYLDYNATTPVDPRVVEKMTPYWRDHFGNPASAGHPWGWAAEAAVKKARAQVAALIGAEEGEIYFTSGASESNNLAIFGWLRRERRENPGRPLHALSSSIEHPSVRRALEYARDHEGLEVDFLPVDSEGRLSLKTVEQALKPHTRFLSVIWVQNEIGSIQDMNSLAELAKEKRIYLHSDATQAVGKIPVDLSMTGVDLLSASAHKFYGPKGVGFLYLRSRRPKVSLDPLIFGGGQEKDLRGGTLNVPGIVGLGEAAEICRREMPVEKALHEGWRDLLWNLLNEKIPGLILNGPPLAERSPVNLSIRFTRQRLESLLPHLGGLAFSTGSACHSGTWISSPVLAALGVAEEQARSTLRLSLGRGLTEAEIRQAAEIIQKACEKSKL